MKKINLKTRKNALRGVVIGLALALAVPVLFTDCASKKASMNYDDVEAQSPEFELTDDCALLHIYRSGSMVGMMVSYHLHLDDEPLFRVKNKSKTTVMITEEGPGTLWARTESKTGIPIDIQLGQEYYIRCGVGMGAFVGRPTIEIVDNRTGKFEYDKISMKKK
jgi:hypothetical protein